MSQTTPFIRFLSRLNKYWVAIIVFVILTFTVGDSTLYKRYSYDRKIRELEREIRLYEEQIAVSRQKLDDLRSGKERLEHYAREEFLMKRANEDVYIIAE